MSSADVIRFPPRRMRCVRIIREASGAWLVVALSHGWIFGDRRSAFAGARWLARNLGLPIREGDPRERGGGA
jgi:hypothetical protein